MTNLIDRDAAIARLDAISQAAGEADLPERRDGLRDAMFAIRALPAVEVGVKWEHIQTAPRGGEWFIARTARGTTRVVHYADEYDRYPISHDSTIWETTPIEWTPLNAALSALTVTPAPDAGKVQALDVELLLDAYKSVLVLHRMLGKHGLTAGTMAAESIAHRIVAAHPEFPAIAAMKEG